MDPEPPTKKRKMVKSEGRAIIANVFKFLQEEYNFMKHNNVDFCDLSPLANIRKRTAEATGVSERTVTQIRKEQKELPSTSSAFPSPLENRRKRDSKFDFGTLNIDMVRSTIQNYHIEHNAMPSAVKLHSLLKEKIGFSGSVSTLRHILINMGYKWQNNGKQKKALQERFDLQLWRLKFLKSIHRYRSEGRPIVYIDESYCIYVRKNRYFYMDVKDKESVLLKNLGSGTSFITILHAGSKDGFIPNAKLVYKVDLNNEDYHPDKSFDTYTKWVEETLLPNLPKRAVIVMDNVLSCHNAHNTKIPTLNSSKADMQKWLTENGISFDESLHNVELYDIIKKSKDRFISYKIDSVIKSEGFDVLRLPPIYPELNPIKKIWKVLKDEITAKNIEKNNLTIVEHLVNEVLDHIDSSVWYNSCTHVENIEKEYMKYFENDFEFVYNVSESDDSESEDREDIDDDE